LTIGEILLKWQNQWYQMKSLNLQVTTFCEFSAYFMFVIHKHKKVPRHHLWSTDQPSLSIIPLYVISHHGFRHAAAPACHRTCAATIAAATAAVSAATDATCRILLIVACPPNFCCCLPSP
jgi:hypothetical protein